MRSGSYPFLWVSLLICCAIKGRAQCPASTPLIIDTIITTESRCQSSGTAGIEVSGGAAPYTYALTGGPVTAPIQSGKVFNALSAGFYTVEITDNCNNKTTGTFRITGNYAVPSVSEVLKLPTCAGLQDGSIQVNVSAGRALFTYSLIAPSPVVTGEQAGNVFDNLPKGDYTYRVKDSCGNFQTRTVTLAENNNNSFYIYNQEVKWLACDSFAVTYKLNLDAGSNFSAPYRAELKLPDGRSIVRWLTVTSTTALDTFRFRYVHNKGNLDWLDLSVLNPCGKAATSGSFMYLDMRLSKVVSGKCGGEYTYTFDKDRDNRSSLSNVHCSTITYSLVDPAGVVIATQVNNSTFSDFPVGTGYKVVREDCCSKDTLSFDWEGAPAKVAPSYTVFTACRNGLAVIRMITTSGIPGMAILLSGPASATLPSGEVKNYVYPDTLKNLFKTSTTGVIGYFGVGNYRFCFVDTCGQRDTTLVAVTTSNLKNVSFTVELERGCVNNNKIIVKGTNNNTFSGMDDVQIKYGSVTAQKVVPRFLLDESFINLAPGTYKVQYRMLTMSAAYLLKNMNAGCEVFDTTIVIPVYRQPYFDNSTIIGSCGSDKLTQVKPDSSSGLLPFEYKLVAGPVVRPAQPDPFFVNLQRGTYTMLMTDACGNSYSNSIAVDSLIKPTPDVMFDCSSNLLWASVLSSYDYQYSWVRPDGTVLNDTYILVDPVTDNDTGTYKLIASSNMLGCTYTEDTSFRVDYCFLLPANPVAITATARNGSVEVNWQTDIDHRYSHFYVERSTNGRSFDHLHKVSATPRVQDFGAVDANPPARTCWYRLRMLDQQGKISYSRVVACKIPAGSHLSVFPVPVQSSNVISIRHALAAHDAQLQVVDVGGRLMMSQRVTASSTKTLMNLRSLVNGSYWLVYLNGGSREVVKIIKAN